MLRFSNDAIRFQKCPSLVLLRLITAVKQEIGKTNDANYQKRGKTKDNVLLCGVRFFTQNHTFLPVFNDDRF